MRAALQRRGQLADRPADLGAGCFSNGLHGRGEARLVPNRREQLAPQETGIDAGGRELERGLDPSQSLVRVTDHPVIARHVLGEEGTRGSLRVGMPADISIFELLEGDYLFVDSRDGNVLTGEQLLVPRATLKRGVRFEPLPRFTSYAQWSHDVSPMLAARQGT